MSHYKKLANETLVYGLGTIVPRFLNFIVLTPFYTRNMNTLEYGVFSEIYTYAVLLLIILTYGTETGYFKFSSNEKFNEKFIYNNILTLLLSSSLIFIVSVNLFVPEISKLMKFGGNNFDIRIFSGILFMDVLASLPFAKLRIQKRIVKFSIIKIINVISNLGLVYLFLKVLPNMPFLQNENLFSYYVDDKVFMVLVANLLASFITLICLAKELLVVKISLDRILLKKIMAYSFPLLIAGISGSLNDTLDKLMLKFLVSYEQLGIYNASYKLAVIITLFIQMFRFAAEPYFFSIEKEKDSRIVYANIMKYFVVIILGIFLVVVLYLDFFKFYLGRNFRSGLYIVPVILFANILFGILININFWFKLSGLTKWAMYIVGLGAVVSIAGNAFLIPKFDILGSAWARVLAYFSMIVLSYSLGRKYYRINYDLKRIGFYVMMASVIFVLGYYVKIENIILKTCYSTGLLIVYIVIVERKEGILLPVLKGFRKSKF